MRGNYEVIDEAISGVCYYFMRLPCSLRLLAMTVRVSTKIAHNTNNLLDTMDKPWYDNE
ncbi:hypothetical protein RAMDARK_0865 [Rickettsia amblyommatis str. Darkwater]|nr:hypothetical protein RAMDARK_0865 [Rickettsia amblyommatis str. Darkwater]